MLRDSENNKGVGIGDVRIKKKKLIVMAVAVLTLLVVFIGMALQPAAAKTWPTSWTWIDSDPDEDGTTDDYRDVQDAYISMDNEYFYLRLCCYGLPNFSQYPNTRYKWFIDLNGDGDASGNIITGAEYLLFVQDTGDDGTGDVYLLQDMDEDGLFSEWEQSPDYYSGGLVTDTNVSGYRIIDNCTDMYVNWDNIGYPSSFYLLMWATDQENPNLEQVPETDSADRKDVPFGPFYPPYVSPVLIITKHDFPDPVATGMNLTYTIIYENTGNVNATNVTIMEVYDANVTFVNATPANDTPEFQSI